ncbi:MAG: YdcF family protein [Pseudomonadota bacterium]|nr:YdcF family protein [Pseudomonadota bacterium]
MFIAAQLLAFVTQPLAWVALLLLLGLLIQRRWRRFGLVLIWLAWGTLLLQGWEPLPDALLRRLEARHPAMNSLPDAQRYTGIVVLGGALEPSYAWQGHGQPALNEAAERMTAALPLLQRHPHLQLLFTGGSGELFEPGWTEAERARIFYADMGVAPQRLLFEPASRTTYENAVLSAQLPEVDKTRPWLLLTSAWHMPRAMAAFEKAGWNVTAYPVDFRTGTETPWTRYSLARAANKWHLALHEYLGLLAYRLSGKS